MPYPEPQPVTTTLLLQRLHASADDEAWRMFDARFRGVILSTGRRLGLTQTEAEEAAQETMLHAVRDYQANRYDRSKGRLSSWIIGIARHRIIDLLRQRKRNGLLDSNDSMIIQDPSLKLVEQAFESSLERQIFQEAWELIRESGKSASSTLLAFELNALRGVPAAEVASQCGMSVEQVYVARNRISQRLKETIERVDQAVRDGL